MKSNKYLRFFSLLTIIIVGSLLLAGCAPTIKELIDKRDVPGLIKALNNKDEKVRASAATALGDFGYIDAATPLIKALEDKSENVRTRAESALVKNDKYVIDQLLVTMENGTSVSPVAKRILEKITENLVEELYDPSSDVVKYAKESLLKIGDMAVDPLIKAIGEGKFGAHNAADVLGDIGEPRTIAPLIIALNNSDALLINSVADALKKMSKDSFEPLLAALKKESGAFYGLIHIGRSGTETTLIKALNAYGDKEMATYYLNCGNDLLKKAASDWAHRNGYIITNVPVGGGFYWGK